MSSKVCREIKGCVRSGIKISMTGVAQPGGGGGGGGGGRSGFGRTNLNTELKQIYILVS